MTRDDYEALAQRVEREEPSRELLERIAAVAGWCLHEKKTYSGAQSDTGWECDACGADSWGNRNARGQRLNDPLPDWLHSLDAAVTLVPPAWTTEVADWDDPDGSWTCTLSHALLPHKAVGHAPTEARARTAAALRARAQEASDDQ